MASGSALLSSEGHSPLEEARALAADVSKHKPSRETVGSSPTAEAPEAYGSVVLCRWADVNLDPLAAALTRIPLFSYHCCTGFRWALQALRR